jgi:hypothetical protein
MKKEFIYCLKDPRDYSVKYIGKSNNPKKRFKEHIKESKNKKTKKEKWINKLIMLNLEPILEILKEINTGEYVIWEPFYIKKFKQEGHKLVNDDENGFGTISGKGRKILKKIHEDSKIRINQYDTDGKFIKSFNSIREAAKEINISHANISRCCNGLYKHASGFIFRKQTDEEPPKKIIHINAKPKNVIEFDLNGNKLNEYFSISQASKETKIDAGNISKVCNNKLKKTKNRIFKFK